MDATTKVLDGYLRKAVNPGNADLDVSALDQFCMTMKNDPKLMTVAPQLLANRIQSGNTREALLALEALEECMETCGREFRSEINKFRFLNELIKLVSKKFDGDRTPREVSERILNILLTWTTKYDNCAKIQEAYKLLKTQGIEHHPQQNIVLKTTPKTPTEARGSLDEKEFAKLRQLINSSKQEDRDKANLLIQNFYRDDERRTQMKHRRLAEVQKAAENTKLLDDMLSQYRPGETTEDELAIYRQIYESCEGMHPTIVRLAEETQHSEGMLEKIFEVNDSLTQVLDKYRQVILSQAPLNDQPQSIPTGINSPSSSSTNSKVLSSSLNITGSDPLDTLFDISTIPTASEPARSVFEDLSDIFSATTVSPSTASLAAANGVTVTDSSPSLVQTDSILTPLVVSSNGSGGVGLVEVPRLMQLATAGSGLNKYAELKNMKPALDPTIMNGKSPVTKKPSSTGTNSTKLDSNSASTGKSIPDLDFLVSGIKSTLLAGPTPNAPEEIPAPTTTTTNADLLPVDDDDKVLSLSTPVTDIPEPSFQAAPAPVVKPEIKSLAEIVIDLDNIQPSRESSRTVWDDKEGLQITLNFAADHPRPDVTVIVISTINQGREPIPSFHFDASVRKPCKLRLLPASGTCLPGTKPFRPPADGITQVLLLANPSGEPVDLTCILTYCVGDDPDPVKESIVMKDVPFVRD